MEVLSLSMSLPSLWSLQNEASHGQNARDRSTHASERARSQQQFRRGRRMTLSNFLPLPSITASPVCTPAPSINSTASDKPLSSFIEKILEGSTAQAQSLVEHQTLNAPPQWMSTPPTPPPKLFRRSITFSTGHPSRIVTPSQSSPTISSAPEVIEEFNLSLRRRRSFPAASSPFNQLFATDATSERKANSNITPKIFPMLAKRLKPIFHLHDLTDDENSPTRSDSPNSIDGGSSVIMDDPYAAEKYKDDIRRYYALTELLSTERSYLNDLRALVVIYLRRLPNISYRTASTSSISFARGGAFSSTSWANGSMGQINPTPFPSVYSSTEGSIQTNSMSTKEPRGVTQPIFPREDLGFLTRNAEDILQLHERFFGELCVTLRPFGFLREMDESSGDTIGIPPAATLHHLEEMIRAVTTKFATESSRFNTYQNFCTGHTEALRLARHASQHHASEWDSFEQQCAFSVQDMFTAAAPPAETQTMLPHSQSLEPRMLSAKDRIRTSSLTSLDGAVRSLRSRVGASANAQLSPEPKKDRQSPRLAFTDYLIKPVQRICKYPLLLDQLKIGKSLSGPSHNPSSVDVVVESAGQAMRHVAASIDEARRLQDIAIQSSLIATRMVYATSASGRNVDILTPDFVCSLGPCMLAGSLDVMHQQGPYNLSNSTLKAKYLGAFLYPVGYLILVKVSKSRSYEPRHWFPLTDFEISDVEVQDALLPHSIRLSCAGHLFELAASCEREKANWLGLMRASLEQPAHWAYPPISSLMRDGKGELVTSPVDEEYFENTGILPTIQSIPELAVDTSQTDLLETVLFPIPTSKRFRRSSRHGTLKQDQPSRRSSTASVKAIFAPTSNSDAEMLIIRRFSPAARLQVDQGLQDVFSQTCIKARSAAIFRDEELFQIPKPTLIGFSGSASTMSVAGITKNRLSRHESVRVPRRNSMLDRSDFAPPRTESLKLPKVHTTHRRRSDRLALTPISYNAPSRGTESVFSSMSPSRSSSATNSIRESSACTSRASSPFLLTPPLEQVQEPSLPVKRKKSLVKNVRRLFSTSENIPSSASPVLTGLGTPKRSPSGKSSLFYRLGMRSVHRRSKSAPGEVPICDSTSPEKENDQQPLTLSSSPVDLSPTSPMFLSPIPVDTPPASPTASSELLTSSLGIDAHSPPSLSSSTLFPPSRRRSFLSSPVFSSERDSGSTRTKDTIASFLHRRKT